MKNKKSKDPLIDMDINHQKKEFESNNGEIDDDVLNEMLNDINQNKSSNNNINNSDSNVDNNNGDGDINNNSENTDTISFDDEAGPSQSSQSSQSYEDDIPDDLGGDGGYTDIGGDNTGWGGGDGGGGYTIHGLNEFDEVNTSSGVGGEGRKKWRMPREKAEKTGKVISKIFCKLYPSLFKFFAFIDIGKLERRAIREGLNLDMKLRIGQDTVASMYEYINNYNIKVNEAIKIPEEFEEILGDAVSDILSEEGVDITPKQRIWGVVGISTLLMSINTLVLVSEKRDIISILEEERESRERMSEETKDTTESLRIKEMESEIERLRNIINKYEKEKQKEDDDSILGKNINIKNSVIVEEIKEINDDDKNNKKNKKNKKDDISVDDINNAISFD